VLLNDWRFIANQFVLATSLLRLMTSNVFLICCHSSCVTSSLTRGWACRLQLLLVLAGTVILRFESRWAHDHIFCLRFEIPPTWRARSPYLYPPGKGFPLIPRALNSRFFASYYSHGYGGGVRPCLHTGSTNSQCHSQNQNQSQSYFTTGGLPRPDFFFNWTFALIVLM
jgi:hypothetical protein